jgi:hypothetical protein
MYDPYACLLLANAWELVSALSESATYYAERGEGEAERCYRLALMLCKEWFPTARCYAETAEHFATYLREDGREREVEQWETTVAQLRAQPLFSGEPFALVWQLRAPTTKERERMSVTERVLYALGAGLPEARELERILREERQPALALHRYLDAGLASPALYRFLNEPPVVVLASIDYEAVIALTLLREQMDELPQDLALTLIPTLPQRDARLAQPVEQCALSLTNYLATHLAALLTLLEEDTEQIEQRERQEVMQAARTALHLCTRVGVAPFQSSAETNGAEGAALHRHG